MHGGMILRHTRNRPPPDRVYDRRSADLPTNMIVAEAIVDDPLALNPGDKIRVLRSIRDDLLAGLRARDQIDDAKLHAGRAWQAYYEQAEIGSVRAIDPGKEAVDGGSIPDAITETQRRAFKKLAEADRALGLEGCALVRDMLASRLSFAGAAHRRELPLRYGKEYLGRRLRECLETLAVLWGFAMKSTGEKRNDQ